MICPIPLNLSTTMEMDPQSLLSFDSHYYKALNQNKGIFMSDATLLANPDSAKLARVLKNQSLVNLQAARIAHGGMVLLHLSD
ncbi:hypothetical protein LguiB_014614 [Lonicera macranthoides]